jgi:hypothetical protein
MAKIETTSARHTYDNYQKKWDKWDNDEFINKAMDEVDDDPKGAAATLAGRPSR